MAPTRHLTLSLLTDCHFLAHCPI